MGGEYQSRAELPVRVPLANASDLRQRYRVKLKTLSHHLYFWVLLAILAGGILGWLAPATGASLKPLGDGFIALVKMLIGPIIFCTVVLGVGGGGDLKRVGRVGGKALLYFELISTLALFIGLVVGNALKPGRGMAVNPASLDPQAVAEFSKKATEQSVTDFVLHLVPKTFFDAFSGGGDLLQILLVSLLFGYALNHLGPAGGRVRELIEALSGVFFRMVKAVMVLAPIGAGGAMAFTVGKYGVQTLSSLAYFLGCFYLTCALFVFVVLGLVARLTGFGIFRFLRYIRDELLTVLGTSSSETALVPLMEKLERLGCSRGVVGLVVPSGYSFNLDGTNIYLTLAVLFVSQAMGIELTLGEQLSILVVAMLTSKGASGVTGAGFITLAATLAVVPKVPVAGLALILGVDRFMSEARAITNIIGNGVATLVVSAWEGELDRARLASELGK
jgi:aerobic C4-dicarboxylate transport protein